jgi:hypothetical protein
MTDPHHLPDTELVEHNTCQIRLSPNGREWLAVVAWPKQRSTLITASGRNAALAKAYGWIGLWLASDKNPE